MKKAILKSKEIVFLLAMLLLCNKYVMSANYTAVASGSWSSSVTWGGTVPGTLITSDQITIPAGITVTLDNNVYVNGALASVNIQGTLNSTVNSSLTINMGSMIGNGVVSISNLMLDTFAVLSFNGQMTVGAFTTSVSNLSLEADIMVNETLTISNGILNLQLGGSLDLAAGADIVISGGMLSVNGGFLGLTSSYDVIYANSSATVGAELNGSGLNNVTVNVSGSNTVTLMSDLNVDGTLTLSSGILVLNGNDLNINGDVAASGSGSISSTSGSNIMINTSVGISGDLRFSANGSSVNNLTLVIASGSSVSIGSDLTIEGTLSLNGGSNLDISGQTLTFGIDGNITGSGSLIVNSSSGLVINSGNGLDASISTYGASIGTFTLNSGSGSVTLANNLTVSGNLYLQSGVLVLNNNDLTISGDISAGGNGTISSTSGSNVIVSGSSSISGSLNFAAGGNTVNGFSVNIGSGNSVSIGSALTVEGTLGLNGGSNLDISGQSLTIGTSGNISGTGSLEVNSSSGLTVNASGGIGTAVSFSGTDIGTFSLNSGSGSIMLGSDLMVSGNLDLQSGVLVLNNQDLTISGNIDSGGNGTISSTLGSDITINGNSTPAGSLNFAAGGNTVSDLSVNVGNGNAVSIGSDLTIEGTLSFTDGSINIGNNMLHIGASGSISGSGSTSYVMTGLIGYLGMNVTAGGSAVTFPVGTANFYAPASVTLNSGSGSGNVYVGAMANVLAQGTSGTDISVSEAMVDATWNVESDIVANLDMDLKLMWSAGMEVNGFNSTGVYISHYTSGSWDEVAAVAATVEDEGMLSVQRQGITSLSPFAVFDRSTSVGLNEISAASLEVFPNPATDVISIRNIDSEVISVDIMSTTGEVLKTVNLEKNNPNVSLVGLGSGNYFLKFYNNDLNTVKRIIKQ